MIKNLLQEAFALKNKGYYKHAIEVFYKALEEDNTSTELLLEIADLYYKMENEEKALSYIEQILDKTPKHIDALKLLKKIFINKKAFEEAEQTAKNIYCISQSDDDLAEIFKLLNSQCKFDEIFEYTVANPSNKILVEQARAMFYKREYKNACDILEKAIAEEPENQEILLLLGQVYYAKGNKDLCIELMSRITEDNTNAELLNFRGLMEDYKGNYTTACKFIKKAIKLSPSDDKYYYNLANMYFKQGDIMYAKKYYNIAISLNPDNPNYQFALANMYYSEKHYKKALEKLPDNLFEANLLKVIILYDTGYLALAKQELKRLLEECPDNNILQEYSEKIDNDLGIR